MNAPTAEVVAIAEPDIAAKNMHVMVVTILSPPTTKPMNVSKKSSIRFAIPPPLIRLPASMKNGTAISGNESQPVTAFCATMISGIELSPPNTRASNVAIPME